jgi:hypothetical protein
MGRKVEGNNKKVDVNSERVRKKTNTKRNCGSNIRFGLNAK